jgi:hypothetical protein
MQRDNRLRCSLHLSFFVEGGVMFHSHDRGVKVVGQVMNRVRVGEGGGLGLGLSRLGGMKFKPEISWKWRLGFVRFDASLGQLSFMKVTLAGVVMWGKYKTK